MSAAELPPADVSVPFARVGTLVRQLTHDVRNGLNAMELQGAFVADLLSDPEDEAEARVALKRLRGMISENARMLQRFAARFRIPTPSPVRYPAKDFIEDFRRGLEKTPPENAPQVAWTEGLGDEAIAVDVVMIFAALGEIFQNAAHFREGDAPVAAHVSAEAGRLRIELREPREAVAPAPETWGREPLVSTRRGGYGLGLFHARQLLAAHGGVLEFSHDPSAALLTTRIFLPLAA